MKDNNIFSSFPTDNSSSTNLKYDIIASKFMTGIQNHQRRNAPASLGLVSAIIQLAIGLVLILGFGLRIAIQKINRMN